MFKLNLSSLAIFLFSYTVAQNIAPHLSAQSNSNYCVGTSIALLSEFKITDPDDDFIEEINIRISDGYQMGEDLLNYQGTNSQIVANWDIDKGKLTINSVNGLILIEELEEVMLNIFYSNSNPLANGSRVFSIYIGDAEYNLGNGHFYKYIEDANISWTSAFEAAANNELFGLGGYLVTVTSESEMLFIGDFVAKTGWISGSDSEQEGVWKWMSGPEEGEIFWLGGVNGTAQGYANWGPGDPSNFLNSENYAHIIQNNINYYWNDIREIGEPSGTYITPGYIIEYGGLASDPEISIVVNISLNIFPKPIVQNQTSCGSAFFEFSSSFENTYWYSDLESNVPIFQGQNFTTPILFESTTFYVSNSNGDCNTRFPVTAIVNFIPEISVSEPNAICFGESLTIITVSNSSDIRWFDSENALTPIASGESFTFSPIESGIIYVQAFNGNCRSERISIVFEVISVPSTEIITQVICKDSQHTLKATNGVAYLWSNGSTLQSIIVDSPGIYTVTIFLENGCSYSEIFTIEFPPLPSEPEFIFESNGIGFNFSNSDNFLFSLDGINFQEETFFNLQSGGEFQLYIIDKLRCNVVVYPFIWVFYKRYFTPNGDSYNDLWTIEDLSLFPNSKVKIFDRYGKLIKTLTPQDSFWDGTFNGNSLLSSDFWFEAQLKNNRPKIKGHFSMKR